MRGYHDFYCESDTLQLADVFENLRDRLMETYGFDVAHSYTLPGFSWKAALKYTGQELELISDREKYDFVEKDKRGGISTVTHRYAKANNPYLGKLFNPRNPSVYLPYSDANNLYGWRCFNRYPSAILNGWTKGN